ncbi:hypothetical protein V493_07883 [Pseudogymnoascus sp. VKM F-4281 (FW-2241)]|nr:hypothetical protein V493_07883 [Pseudogymnoascus sp. VKM F-4281 (FW-2241)]
MSKPPPHVLFEYSVYDSNSLYRIFSPPPFAPGPPLLDDTDTRFLDSFFDGVSSDQYLVSGQYDTWSYEWQNQPPDFLGTSYSFGPQIEPVTNDFQYPTFPEFRNSLEFLPEGLSASEDVMAAASLLRNGNNNNNNPHQAHPNGHHSNAFMAPTSSRPQHMSPLSNQGMGKPEQHSPQQRKMSTRPEDYIRHSSMIEAIYGGASHAPSATFRAPAQKKVEIKWGSDSGFNTGWGFVAPPNTRTLDEIDEKIASTLEFLLPGSNASTRPSSPTGANYPYAHLDRMLEMISEGVRDDVNDGGERPKKRKKNKGKEGVYESDALEQQLQTPNSAAKLPRKRRPKSFGAAGKSQQTRPSPSLHKRLKPTSGTSLATPKMARKNLAKDQRRENHIKSEHKRRTLIKKGFEDLKELVPELRVEGGLSKSAVLIIAADWLEELVRRNEGLRVLVVEMEGRGAM